MPIPTQNQQIPKENPAAQTELDETQNLFTDADHETSLTNIKNLSSSKLVLLPGRMITHNPKAGLNQMVDAAAYLFSVIGRLKQIKSHRHLTKLQKELIQEINLFQDTIKAKSYNPEYLIVCRYILCATFDDIISNTPWAGQGQWESYSLLAAFNQDICHQDKFFNILDRTIKEPHLYIDLMELIYICLSLGYKGQYRSSEQHHDQLEQITNNLYKHIRSTRGNFNKMLSPFSFRNQKVVQTISDNESSSLYLFFVTTCIVMTIFVSLGYLMEVISNEAYKKITRIEHSVFQEIPRY